MILGFNVFHPFNGTNTDTLSQHCADIIVRARSLVAHRTEKEVDDILNLINWILAQQPTKAEADKRLDELFNQYEEDSEKLSLYKNINSIAYEVKAFKAINPIPNYDGLSLISWCEIFAILSLSILDIAHEEEIHYKSWAKDDVHDWLYEWRIHTHVSDWLMEAMDAVATAESYKNIEEFQGDIKKIISSKNSTAAIMRHAKTNVAILEIATMFNSGKAKSMRNSVQIYCENNPEKVKHLAHYNRIRTLTDGLSNHLKGRRRSTQEI